MEPHLHIPLNTKFLIESFRFPSIGKWINQVKGDIVDLYATINYSLIGYKEELSNKKIKVQESDLKHFGRLKKVLSIVDSAIKDTDVERLLKIKQYVFSSIQTIEEILLITEDKLKHERLKSQLHDASVDALNTHLSKYSRAL